MHNLQRCDGLTDMNNRGNKWARVEWVIQYQHRYKTELFKPASTSTFCGFISVNISVVEDLRNLKSKQTKKWLGHQLALRALISQVRLITQAEASGGHTNTDFSKLYWHGKASINTRSPIQSCRFKWATQVNPVKSKDPQGKLCMFRV